MKHKQASIADWQHIHQMHEMMCMWTIFCWNWWWHSDCLKLVRKRQLLQACGSDTSKWSLILISLPKGHASARVEQYWSVWLIYLLSSSFSWAYMLAGWHAVWTTTDSSVLVMLPLGRYLRLKMFREDHGSWMTMFFSTILFLFIFSHIYNLFLLMAGSME